MNEAVAKSDDTDALKTEIAVLLRLVTPKPIAQIIPFPTKGQMA